MGKQRLWPWVLMLLLAFVVGGVLAASYITPVESRWGTIDQLPMTEVRIEHGHLNILRLSVSPSPIRASVHTCRLWEFVDWEKRSDPAPGCARTSIRMGTRVAGLTSGQWGSAPFMKVSAAAPRLSNATLTLIHTRLQVVLYTLAALFGLGLLRWIYRLRLGPRECLNRFLRRIPRVAAIGRRHLVRAGVSLLLALLILSGFWASYYRPLKINRGDLGRLPMIEVCVKGGLLDIIRLSVSPSTVAVVSESGGIPAIANWEYRSAPTAAVVDQWIEFGDGEQPLTAVEGLTRPRWRETYLDIGESEPETSDVRTLSSATYRRTHVILLLPVCMALAVLIIHPLHAFLLVPFYRRLNGLCRRCGYDLTGNLSGVCPECGVRLKGRHGARSQGLAKGGEVEASEVTEKERGGATG